MLILGTLILAFFLIRACSHQEIDDVTPGIPCEEEYLRKAEVLWVIPLFQNESISSNKTWCEYIRSLNKTLGLHGVYHTNREFQILRNEEYLQPGVQAFKECFNQTPTQFKAPQLALSKENKAWLEKKYTIQGEYNQQFHKVYHCSDTGRFPNKLLQYL
ncbi:hypothetical protein FJZ22_02785 [Candidatus Pacearchaeota archaeon]|nr:hypothetical protein [Candidatus Pacearchaeota archaeon]